jgi:hypothetical protein
VWRVLCTLELGNVWAAERSGPSLRVSTERGLQEAESAPKKSSWLDRLGGFLENARAHVVNGLSPGHLSTIRPATDDEKTPTAKGHSDGMPIDPDLYFELSLDELREVTRFAVADATRVLPLFERDRPEDDRPRAAIDAARLFTEGAPRTRLQRTTAVAAHRAAKEATTEAARHAALSAGDAAASAYLHPFAKSDQVGHILRASAHAACAAAALDAGNPDVGLQCIEESIIRATPLLIDVLGRYPAAPLGKGCAAELMKYLDTELRRRHG